MNRVGVVADAARLEVLPLAARVAEGGEFSVRDQQAVRLASVHLDARVAAVIGADAQEVSVAALAVLNSGIETEVARVSVG